MKSNLTVKTLLRHELIGLKIQIVKSAHKDLCGISGTIRDETKNTVVLERDNGRISIIPKGYSTFQIELSNGTKTEVDGKLLIGRPEDRIKKRR
ncbi:MAG: ribonuclease P protein component 1 [Candidatus Lokiarchaeota archaeon]|nr:ribonuclease P protein component 1 [Candidatus Lokiarchaeota archaeon]